MTVTHECSNQYLLRSRRLSARAGAKTLVDRVDLEVRRGEHVMIVGPNGAGKTTLLRCLARMWPEVTGEILLQGRPLTAYSRRELARRMALVQQTPAPVFGFTVEEVVRMGRYPHLRAISPFSAEDHRVVGEVMERMEIDPLAARKVQTLSGGERQKVFLAAALAQQPEILLLDEPTTFLDYRHQEEIARFLHQLHRERGTTLVEVTHDLNRAVLHADRIVGLAGGKVLFEGTPWEIMQPEKLRALFGMEFQMVRHPVSQLPMIVPSSFAEDAEKTRGGSP